MGTSVREATFDVLRRRGLTTMFANPGSTEVPFLADLPDDIRFVLGLHEGSVVGLASGFAIARDEPALVLLHTTAGLGTAVSGLATARVNRSPLVVLVGQQDRRHLAYEPFLAGRLSGLAGEYPVGVEQPARAQDVPAAVERAFHVAELKRGPALVIVPMDDWDEPADEEREPAGATGPIFRGAPAAPEAVEALVTFLEGATAPALVVGAGADDAETWSATRASWPSDSCRRCSRSRSAAAQVSRRTTGSTAGVLSAQRARLREQLEPYDAILVVGAAAFRQAPYVPGRFTAPGTRIAVLSDDPDEVHRSPADLAVLAAPAAVAHDTRRPRARARHSGARAPFSPAFSRGTGRRRAAHGEPCARRPRRAPAA